MSRDEPPPVRYRTVPRAEHPRGTWVAPVRGVFLDVLERWSDPSNEATFLIELEPGVVWRSTTPEDRARLSDWFDFFKEGHSRQESESVIGGADSVLSPTEPVPLEESATAYSKLVCFLTALSLHTRVPLNGRVLIYEIQESPDSPLLPERGYSAIETARLPTWGNRLQEPLSQRKMGEVPATFRAVVRAFAQSMDHSFNRMVGAYRAAVSRQAFMAAIPILTCASLEALTASDDADTVIRRLTPRFVPESDRGTLERLYLLRHWFAHGAAIPTMKDANVRAQTADEGLTLAKGVVRAALVDNDVFDAASSGTKALRRFLDS